jgi:diaminopimelate decarboxylase
MTAGFHRRDGELHVDGVPLRTVADHFGTPTYVYSARHMAAQFRLLDHAFAALDHQICYAVKANSNIGVLNLFARLGAGFDIVSGGELERVLRAGGDPSGVVFSGVGKSTAEIDLALKVGIQCFNVESAGELARIEQRARLLGRTAPVSVRVNPDIDARTHPYISTGLKSNKFGVPAPEAKRLYRQAADSPHLQVRGLDCHIGSLVREPEPILAALGSLLELADDLARHGIAIEHVDIGGGLGIPYREQDAAFDVERYATGVTRLLAGLPYKLVLEPGRFLVAEAGVLLTRVEYLKPACESGAHAFAVVDAGMNDLIRPTLYQAYHRVEPVIDPAPGASAGRWDVVGPVCESADFLALDRELALETGALLAIRSAGAYGFVQSSNYNSRDRAAEVMVDDARVSLVRERETIAAQLALERLPEWPLGEPGA